MTAPPPPGPWGTPPGPSGFGQSAHGKQPPGPPPPGYPQQGSPPPWYPPPPSKGSSTKWIALAVVAVAAAAAVIVVVLHSNSAGSSKSSTTAASDIASANDKGPVTVITQDPSCSAWESIDKTLAASVDNGWVQRDSSIPAARWTLDQRRQYEAVGPAFRTAADQTVALAKLTPHRVMRELYEQFIAYGRDYADHIPNYAPSDDALAGVANSAANTLGAICDAIAFDAAAKRGPLVSTSARPAQTSPPSDPANPQRFLTSTNAICGEWLQASTEFDDDTAAFRSQDFNVPAAQWTTDQKAVNQATAAKMSSWAARVDQLGQRSGNPQLDDFANLSGQYYRAFVLAVSTYVTADSNLLAAAGSASAVVRAACQAVGG